MDTGLIKSSFSAASEVTDEHSVTVPAPPCSSTAEDIVTSRKDVEAWWEAMIECASNTYQSSLQELHFIDRLPPLCPNPLAALYCLCTSKWAKHASQARSSGNFYWFDLFPVFPLVWKKALQGNCSDLSSRCCEYVLLTRQCCSVCWCKWVIFTLWLNRWILCHGVRTDCPFSFLNLLSVLCECGENEWEGKTMLWMTL